MTVKTQQSPAPGTSKSGGLRWTWLASIPVLVVAAVLYYPPLQNIQISFAEPRPSVTIKQGTIVGRLVDDGSFPKPLEGFMGIPYALPPVNDLRFRPAVPVPEGNGTQEAFFLGARYGIHQIGRDCMSS